MSNERSDINIKSKSKNRMKYDIISAGGVVYHRKNGKMFYLLLKHSGGKKHWDLPKGHLDKGESIEECAIREVIEETGLKKHELIFKGELDHKNIYSKFYKLRKSKIKVVHLFLFESMSEKIILSHEHSKFKWLEIQEIETKLTYQTSRPAFEEARQLIEKINAD